MLLQAPKGTRDMLPQNAYKWQYLENKFRKIAAEYCCREIRTPIFEYTELFQRGVGETTDVVQKEMYTFEDKGGRSITLKPEGTSPAVRAFVEGRLFNESQPTKMYYFTPVFRYENVQNGRLRQHHQFGVEVFGAQDASVDAEIISIPVRIYKELGLEGVKLTINSIGCAKCRKKYNEALKEYLNKQYDELCDICKTRFDKNPLRILDCKNNHCKEIVKEAPVILDYICDECKDHFESLKGYLDAMDISYEVDPLIVRGLDYYSKTVFEFIMDGMTICGGGRYDYLIGEIGGTAMPAVGFGMGIERLLITLEEKGIEIKEPVYVDLYLGYIGEKAKMESMKIVKTLRENNIKCDLDHMGKKVKGQMKYANKINAAYTLILGEDELENGKASLKRMSDGEQIEIDICNLNSIIEVLK
ncbi:histidine--tRNA ligase [Clostridium niameyense]|uniref:histidine--tRNA ligase n=1 Tax=Clostridium niameyense TaxID=1622073 RepID=UPI00067EA323|nr:histidine--tRNA ligase [Clostridium niameyense]